MHRSAALVLAAVASIAAVPVRAAEVPEPASPLHSGRASSGPRSGRMDDVQAPQRPAEKAPPTPDAQAPSSSGAGEQKPSLDFDLLPPPPKATADARLAREVARRRTMLTLHQGLGMATWAALAATTIVGQLDLNDRFRGGGDTGRFHPWHKGLAYGTSALFLGTGLLAVLAPVPYPKRLGLDTATLHKASMAIATAGMITQIVLGTLAHRDTGSLGERDLARAHQAVGYATLGAMTAGWAVLLF